MRPGDTILFQGLGDITRVLPPGANVPAALDLARRLALFDAGTQRQRAREAATKRHPARTLGWTREELCRRGSSD